MIKVEFTTAVTIYLFISLAVLFFWLRAETKRGKKRMLENDVYLWECPLCLHEYVDSSGRDVSQCPRCKSFARRYETVNKQSVKLGH